MNYDPESDLVYWSATTTVVLPSLEWITHPDVFSVFFWEAEAMLYRERARN